ncbi:MAG: hypothetical protein KAS32_10885 [Candidatus Peribacteraceae bacterium]|nr:hypothetical protein [Candidatus Peribacteraceae bacterium]
MKEHEDKLKLALLLCDISYELSTGVHTYHQCKCGRMQCRNECPYCLIDKFREKQNVNDT